MSFLPFGNKRVTVAPRRALIEPVEEQHTPRRAKGPKVSPSILVHAFTLVGLLLALVVGDTQATSAGASAAVPASVIASTVPVEATAQTSTSATQSARETAKPIPKVVKTSPPVKPKITQSENFVAAMTVARSSASSSPSQKASTPPKKPVETKKAPTPKKRTVQAVAASTSSGSSKGLRALAYAKKQLGEPYRMNAAGPNAWDCSGLTMKAWGSVGVSLPHSARAQYAKGKRVAKSNLRKGDLVYFYHPIHHVGIYAGDGKVLHASRPGKPVAYIPMKYMPYAGATRPG